MAATQGNVIVLRVSYFGPCSLHLLVNIFMPRSNFILIVFRVSTCAPSSPRYYLLSCVPQNRCFDHFTRMSSGQLVFESPSTLPSGLERCSVPGESFKHPQKLGIG